MVWKQVTRLSEPGANESDRKMSWRIKGRISGSALKDGRLGGLHADHACVTRREQLSEEDAVARADIDRAVAVRELAADRFQPPAIGLARVAGLAGAVEVGRVIKPGEIFQTRCLGGVEHVTAAAFHEPPVHIFRQLA